MPTEYPIKSFQGLDLRTDPEDVGSAAAVDMLNVDLDHPEKIRTRDGWSLVTSSAASTAFRALGTFQASDGTDWIVAADTTTLHPYKTDGTAGTTQTAAAGSNNSFAAFGDPSNTLLYVATTGLYKFDGSTWTSVGGLPVNPTLLAVTPNDNRLAMSDGTSRVYFSDAGAPETVGSSNYVDLWPGDGEGITALVRFRDKLFAFKQSKFAVFTGTSEDPTGNPIFNYYGVVTGRGCWQAGCAVVGDQGVYFLDSFGFEVYATTGGDPVLVSDQITPWLDGSNSDFPPVVGASTVGLAFSEHRLYVNFGTSQAVLDTRSGRWMLWQITASSMLGVKSDSTIGLYFGDSGTKKLAVLGGTTDNGSAIPWHWTSGWYDFGAANQEKLIAWSTVSGSGNVTLARYVNYGSTDTNSATLALGTGSLVRHLKSWRGTLMQHKLSGSGVASVSSLSHAIRSVRPPGVRSV